MSMFTKSDRKKIESLVYDKSLSPGFDAICGCLKWKDEIPDGLTPEGYEALTHLFIARSFIHEDLPFSSWEIAPTYFEEVWQRAIDEGLKWPGFYRIKLSESEKEFLGRMKEEHKYEI